LFNLLNEIAIIEQLARNRFESLRPAGLRLAHFTLLNHLARVGDGRTPASIANALQLAKGAITNTLQRLETRGFVRVEPDASDGRAKRVWLTEAGRAARLDAVRQALGAFADLGAVLPEERALALLPDLRALRGQLDRFRAPARSADRP
jgi:DNA-binding MarR family transcriptional regulator